MKIRIVNKDGSNYIIKVENVTVDLENKKLTYQTLGYTSWEDISLEDVKTIVTWNE